MGNLQSNPSSSTQTFEKKYDVFLNFRGVDTRDGFTNYLYAALLRKSIETFRDEEKIPKGDQIGPTLLKAIRESKISVVIFSKEYASSKWCLRELVEILKSGQTVIPVFYKVTVHDVRHQEGSFKDGFDQLEKEFEENLEKEQVDSADLEKSKQEFYNEMQEWSQALKAACDRKGWPYEKGLESKVIEEIVKDISENLMRAYKLSPRDFEGKFGLEERFTQVMSLLSLDNTDDVRIIGIWGMGGIGKTTIAEAIYPQISDDDYGRCFINFRQRLGERGRLVSELQQKVLSRVFNDEHIELDDSVTLPPHIKERLCRKKVFIVLDDVDDFLKVKELAGGLDRLSPGSRIVMTTRDRDILRKCHVKDDCINEVKGLSDEEAQMLFCKHAFRQSPLTKDLMALLHETLHAINGNPLGLIVVGSSLPRWNEQKWQSALNRLKKSRSILDVLQISYDGLEEEDRHAFLDIACFFVGEQEDYVATVLDHSCSLEVLSDKSLITISDDKIIEMHDLLQEMGMEIVRTEDHNNPGNRSRLSTQEDVLETLRNGDGTNAIRGISLDMSRLNSQMNEELSSQAFQKMKNLMFLKFYDFTARHYGFKRCISKLRFSNGISYLPNKLKSLEWVGYPLKALPSNFNPNYLIKLNLSYSNIEELWEKNTCAPKLKWIILDFCPYFKVLDGLDAPLLEKISICCAPQLEKINIFGCDSFLGSTSHNHFPSLTCLYLSDCYKLTGISVLFDAPLLEQIYLHRCHALLEFSSPVDRVFNKLRKLEVYSCKNLQSFGKNIHFPSLISVRLSYCDSLTEFLELSDAPLLETIYLWSCERIKRISSSICKLKALKELRLYHCSALECFPEILDTMGSLEVLTLYGTAIKGLHHSIENLSRLESLVLGECKNLEMLPISIYNLTSLHTLNLANCTKLENLPGNLVTDLSNCGESTTTKPPSWRLDKCQLDFTNCLKLNKTAVINIMELQINQHRDMTTKGCGTQAVNLKFVYPGSQVPGWFDCQSQTDGSSINIQMSGHDGVNGHLIGFAPYAVIEGYHYFLNISYQHHCHCKSLSSWTSDGARNNRMRVICLNETLTDHVVLWYTNASVLQLCGKCTNYLFEFFLQEDLYSHCRVKYCGVCLIYERHNITLPNIANETCGAADKDFGETSSKEQGKIRKFLDESKTSGRSNEDVIEPHPKRTCS